MGEKRREGNIEELVNHAFNGIYQAAPDGGFLRANPALVRLLGYETEGELRAARFGDLILDETGTALLEDHLRENEEIRNVVVYLRQEICKCSYKGE